MLYKNAFSKRFTKKILFYQLRVCKLIKIESSAQVFLGNFAIFLEKRSNHSMCSVEKEHVLMFFLLADVESFIGILFRITPHTKTAIF